MKADASAFAQALRLRLQVETARSGSVDFQLARVMAREVLNGLDRATAAQVVELINSDSGSSKLRADEYRGLLAATAEKLPVQLQVKSLSISNSEPELDRLHLKAVIRALASNAAKNRYFIDDRIGEGFDLNAIKNARRFTMHLDAPGAEDAIVAAGVALARQVPSLYLVPSRNDLPWFLREIEQTHPGLVRVVESKNVDALLDRLAKDGEELVSFPATQRSATPSGAATDTFIGCLMSGLSEVQYAEGRSHLLAIDEALRASGSTKNHCEGIQVASTASFGSPKESLLADLAAIRDARRCVFYQYDGASRPSGMWVEAGVALGLGKPCQFLVPHDRGLPPGLAEAIESGQANGATKRSYETHDKLLVGLSSYVANLVGV